MLAQVPRLEPCLLTREAFTMNAVRASLISFACFIGLFLGFFVVVMILATIAEKKIVGDSFNDYDEQVYTQMFSAYMSGMVAPVAADGTPLAARMKESGNSIDVEFALAAFCGKVWLVLWAILSMCCLLPRLDVFQSRAEPLAMPSDAQTIGATA